MEGGSFLEKWKGEKGMGEGERMTMASLVLFWGGEVYFTTALVKMGEDESPHHSFVEKQKRMTLYPPLLGRGGSLLEKWISMIIATPSDLQKGEGKEMAIGIQARGPFGSPGSWIQSKSRLMDP